MTATVFAFFISLFVFELFCNDMDFLIKFALGFLDDIIWIASSGKFDTIDALARWHELSFGSYTPDPYEDPVGCFKSLAEILQHWAELHQKGEI